jgi:histidine triad (HIT) family protein
MDNCIFCKIANKEVPKEFIYEDEEVMVFKDLNPVRPVHVLIVPKMHVSELVTVTEPVLFQQLFIIVQNMIAREGLRDKGYRIVINGGGAQVVDHLHIHLMGPINKTAAL